MVRVKYRYIVLNYDFESDKKYEISQQTLSDIIKSLINKKYGIFGLSKLTNVIIFESMPINGIILFRVPRMISKEVVECLSSCKILGGNTVNMRVLFVSGCVRNARKRTMEHTKIVTNQL